MPSCTSSAPLNFCRISFGGSSSVVSCVICDGDVPRWSYSRAIHVHRKSLKQDWHRLWEHFTFVHSLSQPSMLKFEMLNSLAMNGAAASLSRWSVQSLSHIIRTSFPIHLNSHPIFEPAIRGPLRPEHLSDKAKSRSFSNMVFITMVHVKLPAQHHHAPDVNTSTGW